MPRRRLIIIEAESTLTITAIQEHLLNVTKLEAAWGPDDFKPLAVGVMDSDDDEEIADEQIDMFLELVDKTVN